MGVLYLKKEEAAKRIRDDAAREKHEGTPGQWQRESLFREILEHARRNEDVGVRRSYHAIRDSGWE